MMKTSIFCVKDSSVYIFCLPLTPRITTANPSQRDGLFTVFISANYNRDSATAAAARAVSGSRAYTYYAHADCLKAHS